MNILLWVLQVLLALHTAVGAVWKFSNPAQSLPSLSAIPQGAWLTISLFELACVAGLLIPALYKPLAILAPGDPHHTMVPSLIEAGAARLLRHIEEIEELLP
jgi:hypothetical protein